MSTEERIYKQLENISASIIKALEGLETELAEYIQVTDSRLNKLEDKIKRLDALADVSSKGLVKTIEDSTDKEKVATLSHIATPTSNSTPQPSTPLISQTEELAPQPTVSSPVPSPELAPQATVSSPTPDPEPSPVITPIETSNLSEIPKVPIPPSFKPVLQEEEPAKEEIIIPQPKDLDSSLPKSSIAEELEEKKKKEADKDKDDLMSALKMIDSL